MKMVKCTNLFKHLCHKSVYMSAFGFVGFSVFFLHTSQFREFSRKTGDLTTQHGAITEKKKLWGISCSGNSMVHNDIDNKLYPFWGKF